MALRLSPVLPVKSGVYMYMDAAVPARIAQLLPLKRLRDRAHRRRRVRHFQVVLLGRRLRRVLLEAHGRVERAQEQARDGDGDGLEHDDELLRRHQLALPALADLDDAVEGAHEDEQRREGEREEHRAEALAAPQPPRRRVLVEGDGAVAPHRAQRAHREVAGQGQKDEQGEGLEGEPRHHREVAVVRHLLARGVPGRQGAAGGLQDQRDDVAADEDAGNVLWRDSRVLGAEGNDDAGEGEVDGRRKEGRGEREGGELRDETDLVLSVPFRA